MTNNNRENPSGDSILPPIKYVEYKLSNGLRVVLHQDRSTPIVAVNIWYHVGSKNEVPGRTGFAHLFEHMMFQGSKHYDDDFFIPLQEAGGTLNGSTNADRTNYWEVVPSNFIELALWLESDRMGYLPDAMTEEKLKNQRDVVKNEKRQNYDNRPYGLVSAKIAETMYPPDHPYHWLTIGSLDDLNAASMDDVKDFFRRFYTPNNASLVIAGDFDETETRRLVEKYFGPLKSGPEVQEVAAQQPQLERETRISMDDRVQLPRIYLAWHSAPQWSGDDAALDLLSSVLAGGKGSRLYKSLVYEKQIAQDASAFHSSREIAGQFQIVATAKPDRTIKEIEEAINQEIAKIKAAPPTAEEMERVYNAVEASFVYGLQTVGGFGGKSDQLNQYAVFLNNPGFLNNDLMRYRRVTAVDVQAAANRYLTEKRLILNVAPSSRGSEKSSEPSIISPSAQVTATPRPAVSAVTLQKSPDVVAGLQTVTKAEASATTPAGSAPAQASSPGGAHASTKPAKSPIERPRGGLFDQPQPKPDPVFNLPKPQRRRLTNGLEVLFVENHELPVVNMNLVVKTGAAADVGAKLAGLASLTADMLDEGTKTRSALDVSNQLAAIGARLGSGAGFDSSAVNLLTLTRHLDRALEIYAEVILKPIFPQNELERLRASRSTSIMQRRDNASEIADLTYASLLYGREHPYGNPLIGTEASLRATTEEDVRRFYETYYRPNNAALIVAGDISPDLLLPKLEKAFADWKPNDVAGNKHSKANFARTLKYLCG
ncbi:MAG: pitrilysin family protein [Pyrinomonadaceae bacterium]